MATSGSSFYRNSTDADGHALTSIYAEGHALFIPADATVPTRHPDAPTPGSPITSHYRLCFGCGVDHPTGLHLSITASDDLAVDARFTVTDHHQGAPGIGHGGLLSTAFDESLSATNWLLRIAAVTAHLEVGYLAPVPVDSEVFIHASIIASRGRKVWAHATGRLGSPNGPLAVRAASLFIQVPVEHFITHGRASDIQDARQDKNVTNRLTELDIAP